MFIKYNSNPQKLIVGDCVIRAISKATNTSWNETYLDLVSKGLYMSDLINSNGVWGAYLKDLGFTRHIIPDSCPDCYSIKEFCIDHSTGTFVVATGTHVVTVINGNYYDTWDSGDEIPIYYFER